MILAVLEGDETLARAGGVDHARLAGLRKQGEDGTVRALVVRKQGNRHAVSRSFHSPKCSLRRFLVRSVLHSRYS